MAEPATGVKISQLVEASYILAAAKFEIAQEGDNFKVPFSLLIDGLRDLPRFSVSQVLADATITALILNTPAILLADASLDSLKSAEFELASNTKLKYTGEMDILLLVNAEIGQGKGSGAGNVNGTIAIYKNGLLYGIESAIGIIDNITTQANVLRQIQLSKNDSFEFYVENITSGDDYELKTLNYNGFTIKPEDNFLGPELFENADLLTLDGISQPAGTLLSLIPGGGVLAERNVAGGVYSQPVITITGLTVSVRHRLEFTLKRGAQGTGQEFYVQNAFSVVTTTVNAGAAQSFVYDFVAVSNTIQIVVNTGGPDGDEIEILTPITCKKYL